MLWSACLSGLILELFEQADKRESRAKSSQALYLSFYLDLYE